jgi:hypothetical protein
MGCPFSQYHSELSTRMAPSSRSNRIEQLAALILSRPSTIITSNLSSFNLNSSPVRSSEIRNASAFMVKLDRTYSSHFGSLSKERTRFARLAHHKVDCPGPNSNTDLVEKSFAPRKSIAGYVYQGRGLPCLSTAAERNALLKWPVCKPNRIGVRNAVRSFLAGDQTHLGSVRFATALIRLRTIVNHLNRSRRYTGRIIQLPARKRAMSSTDPRVTAS